jgi:osmotically-inducible protein OsmY
MIDTRTTLPGNISIAAEVLTALALDPRTADAAIEVAALAGAVYLAGAVDAPATKAAAEEVARRVAAGRVVINQIQVRPRQEPRLPFPPMLLGEVAAIA